MATRKDRTEYPEEVKETTLEAYEVTGSPTLVGKVNGIPQSTISTWAQKDREKMDTNTGKTEEEAASMIAAQLRELRFEKKRQFIEAGWLLAKKILDEMEKKVTSANFKDLATGMGILFDKIALASGEATARTESNKTVSREDMLDAARTALDEKCGKGKGKTA